MSMHFGPNPPDDEMHPIAWPDMEPRKGGGAISVVSRWFERQVCRYGSHDWWSLAYPPARRWECRRCHLIVEEAATSLPDRRRLPRDKTRPAAGPNLD
jgi:hypothetical protein